MKKIGKWLYDELLAGRSWFDWAFLALGLICQTVAYMAHPTTSVHLVAGITGIISVYLCAQGKISMFIFSVLNIVTYIAISYQQRLFGEVAINAFYFACQAIGIYTWARHYQQADAQKSGHLKARFLSSGIWYAIIFASILGSLATGYYLDQYTTDSDPYFDAFTTVPAFFAEIMMVTGIAQHWYFWIVIDIASIWMWLRAGDYSMAMLKTFWLLNCVYGYYQWTKNKEKL